jgi:hypothetical protein
LSKIAEQRLLQMFQLSNHWSAAQVELAAVLHRVEVQVPTRALGLLKTATALLMYFLQTSQWGA